MTAKTKTTFIQFRVREDIKDDVQTVAELRGLSMSALIHSLLMKAVREEKALSPEAFKKLEETIPVPVTDDPELQLTGPKRKRKGGKG